MDFLGGLQYEAPSGPPSCILGVPPRDILRELGRHEATKSEGVASMKCMGEDHGKA